MDLSRHCCRRRVNSPSFGGSQDRSSRLRCCWSLAFEGLKSVLDGRATHLFMSGTLGNCSVTVLYSLNLSLIRRQRRHWHSSSPSGAWSWLRVCQSLACHLTLSFSDRLLAVSFSLSLLSRCRSSACK